MLFSSISSLFCSFLVYSGVCFYFIFFSSRATEKEVLWTCLTIEHLLWHKVTDFGEQFVRLLHHCIMFCLMTGVEKQVLESTVRDSVNEQNATNQAELSSVKTDGINTSAGKPCISSVI